MASEVSCPPKEETRIRSTKIIADSVVAELLSFNFYLEIQQTLLVVSLWLTWPKHYTQTFSSIEINKFWLIFRCIFRSEMYHDSMVSQQSSDRTSSGTGSTDVAGNSRLHFFKTTKTNFLDRLNPAGHGDFENFCSFPLTFSNLD